MAGPNTTTDLATINLSTGSWVELTFANDGFQVTIGNSSANYKGLNKWQ